MKESIKNGEKVTLGELTLPEDLKDLTYKQCRYLCGEIRALLISTVSKTGGHLASNLGVVELTLALHRNFRSPDDKIIWDVGHQSYVHKILTGRADRFSTLRQKGGISGFPKPEESEHDSFISGHSSTSVSVACGIAEAMKMQHKDSYAVAVIGDGAMTGGMFYEGMNNAGKDHNTNLIVMLNDNDMSISKSVGALSPVAKGIKNVKDSVKNSILDSNMFEDMGFVYLGPVDGHDLAELEEVIHSAKSLHQPVFIHVRTVKGKGYLPAEKNPGEYHGISKFDIVTGNPEVSVDECYSTVFGKELADIAEQDDRICAITAAMKYGTGLQFFASRIPSRFFDVGIAEQHAVTFAGGLASMGQIPVFAVYSTFLQRAYDQLVHDVAIGKLHVVLAVDRAGIVGEDGETHQGLMDVPMLTSIPGSEIYSPACYDELKMCLKKALYATKGLTAVRYPRGAEQVEFDRSCANTEHSFQCSGSSILIVSYGRLYNEAYKAQKELKAEGIECDLLKLTKIYPISSEIPAEMMKYSKVVFFEESFGCGSISEIVGELLAERGYTGDYSRVTAEGFVKQASAKECLDQLGMSSRKMAEHIRRRCGNGEA